MKVNQFNQYTEEVQRNIPDLLLATMNILYSQYKEIKYCYSETNYSNCFYLNLDFCATIRSSTLRAVNKFGIIGDFGNKEQVFQTLNSCLNYFFINCFNNNF
jgi:hypothetical protein